VSVGDPDVPMARDNTGLCLTTWTNRHVHSLLMWTGILLSFDWRMAWLTCVTTTKQLVGKWQQTAEWVYCSYRLNLALKPEIIPKLTY